MRCSTRSCYKHCQAIQTVNHGCYLAIYINYIGQLNISLRGIIFSITHQEPYSRYRRTCRNQLIRREHTERKSELQKPLNKDPRRPLWSMTAEVFESFPRHTDKVIKCWIDAEKYSKNTLFKILDAILISYIITSRSLQRIINT